MYYWFVFNNRGELLLQKCEDGTFTIPYCERVPVATTPKTHIMNISPMDSGEQVKALQVDDVHICADGTFEGCGLRQSYYKLSRPLYLKAGKCHELLYWDRNTQYCGVCGSPMEMDTDISKKCPNCGKTIWPQLATAIIVLINRGDDLLLVHAKNFKTDFYGCIAGFVETGESLEEAVRREVWEETSISIKNLRYFKSQPWPYPCGLMVGFFAEYDGGDLKLQESELSRGNWFNKNNLPTIPEKLSLARILIDKWLEEHS